MSTLKVSLPSHLREALDPLVGVLPPELEAFVIAALNGSEIMYTTLVDVSKWAHTDDGKQKLESKNLNYKDYDRISLLAGTVAGPATRLPPPEPQPEPWEVAQDEKNTRRAIAALVNGLFSVVGIGAAVWWASNTSGWNDVTRMSFSIVGGLITALAEGGLFAIYYNRRENAKKYRQQRREKQRARLHARYVKLQPDNQTAAVDSESVDTKSADGSGTNVEGPMETLDSKGVTDLGPLRRRKKGGKGEADLELDS